MRVWAIAHLISLLKSTSFRLSRIWPYFSVEYFGYWTPDKVNKANPPFTWHYFQLKGQELLAFAGLFDVWVDKKNGKEIHSYTIITTTPNELVGKYHERMPVILKKEDEETWLNPDITEPEHLLPLLKSYPAVNMEEWQVGDAARNPRNDYPDLINPVSH